jgi:hypothetical protein
MAISTSHIIQQRWPKSNNKRGSSPIMQKDQDTSSSANAKQQRGDFIHSFLVFWNNCFHHRSSISMQKLQSLGATMMLCSILGILLFHPPCYRQRAKNMPLCRISRDWGFYSSSSSSSVQTKRSSKTVAATSSGMPPQERTRILLGFMSAGNDKEERQRREYIRKQMLMARDNGKNVCCLQDYLLDPEANRECVVLYSFLQGGNPDGTHLDFNKTYVSTLKFEETSFFAEQKEPEEDSIFLNVQDSNNIRKVFAWFDYTAELRMEPGRKFDYVGFTDTQHSIDADQFLTNNIFRSTTTVQHTYGGIQTTKSQCQERQSKKGQCSQSCPTISNDLIMSNFVVVSRDLRDYCLHHSNLIQLDGVYPQDCPDLAIASLLGFHPSRGLNSTHLEGIVPL